MPRSLKKRSAFFVFRLFFVPKICIFTLILQQIFQHLLPVIDKHRRHLITVRILIFDRMDLPAIN